MIGHGFDDAILDVARGVALDAEAGAALRAHLAVCPDCAAKLQQDEALTRGLRALAAAAEDGPSDEMQRVLLTAFAGMQPARPLIGHRWQPFLALAAAAMLVAATTAVWRGFEISRHQAPAAPARDASAEFVRWPGAAALPTFESGQLVRMELPASVLPLLGLSAAPDVNGKVQADVLVGQDGYARAVRLAR